MFMAALLMTLPRLRGIQRRRGAVWLVVGPTGSADSLQNPPGPHNAHEPGFAVCGAAQAGVCATLQGITWRLYEPET